MSGFGNVCVLCHCVSRLSFKYIGAVLSHHGSRLCVCVCVLVVPQVSIYSVTMPVCIKCADYNHEYRHKQSRYMVKEYSRYSMQLM